MPSLFLYPVGVSCLLFLSSGDESVMLWRSS